MYNHLRYNDLTGHICTGSHGRLSADCGAVPTSCSFEQVVRYKLFEVEQLFGCPQCIASSNGEPWDGSFINTLEFPCIWLAQNQDGYGSANQETLRIGNGVVAQTGIQLWTDTDPHWLLFIHCESDEGIEPIWFGRKDAGQTPLGYYTRMFGWLTTSTLTIH